MKPGLYPDLTYDEYAAIPAIRHSSLKEMARSPLHYQHALKAPRKDTDAFRWGRLVHCAALEPKLFTEAYVLREHGMEDVVIWEGGIRRGKAWTEFQALHEGKVIVKPDEIAEALALMEKAALVASILHSDPVAGPLLARGHREGAVVWLDEQSGLTCKARFDSAFLTADGFLCDLKTSAKGLDSRTFGSTAAGFSYHQQLAFYSDGIAAVTGLTPPVAIIAIESAEPHDCVVYDLDEDTLAIGRQGYRDLLDQLAHCQRNNEWPGYARGSRMPLRLPQWALPNDDDLASLGLEP